jgi:hypothetical protein
LTVSETLIEDSYVSESQVGFFELLMQSKLLLQDNVTIRNVGSKLYGVIEASSQSELTLRRNVTIHDCPSTLGTISVTNSPNVTISESHFFSNPMGILMLDHVKVSVENSDFTSGAMQFIYLNYGNMTLKNVTMHDSVDVVDGDGVLCVLCDFV